VNEQFKYIYYNFMCHKNILISDAKLEEQIESVEHEGFFTSRIAIYW